MKLVIRPNEISLDGFPLKMVRRCDVDNISADGLIDVHIYMECDQVDIEYGRGTEKQGGIRGDEN